MTEIKPGRGYTYFLKSLFFLRLWIVFLAFLFSFQSLIAQIDPDTAISGIINKYTRVVDVFAPGTNKVKVKNLNGFYVHDAVMIIQMKYTEALNAYPDGDDIYNHISTDFCGNYEILKIDSISYSDSIIFFSNSLYYDDPDIFYDTAGFVQLIRVPIYKSVTVLPAGVQCRPWNQDSAIGGVLAFFTINKLTLLGNIDVSGSGFHGGDPDSDKYTGTCVDSSLIYLQNNYADSTLNRAGPKGEGIALDIAQKLKGKGYRITNPGGGNGLFSGGGGGGNYGGGGRGGNQQCSPSIKTGGLGANSQAIDAMVNPSDQYAFMGSGGGAGTQMGNFKANKGGNGGGIAIIVTHTISSPNGFGILANGNSVDTASAGAGGGGGGGAIFLNVDNYLGPIKLGANGGNGGSTSNGGPGGGGGAGYIFYKNPFPHILNFVDGGRCGTNISTQQPYGAVNGDPSTALAGLQLKSKAFLFNFFFADSEIICKGVRPKKILGTIPKGGDGLYKYIWIRSYDNNLWTDTVQSISADSTYQPPIFPDSVTVVYYRRIVLSGYNGASYAFTDVSSSYKIRIFPPIQNNFISSPDFTLCSGVIPSKITGTLPTNGNGAYSYSWIKSDDSINWSLLEAVTDSISYNPIQALYALNKDSSYYFRRAVFSGGCSDSSNIKIIKILPKISGNQVAPQDQSLCQNIIPSVLHNSASLNGGDNAYVFKWQVNKTGSPGWDTIIGRRADTAFYQPDSLNKNELYRRIVFSGPNAICKDTSNTILLDVRLRISSNKISSSQTIVCAGTLPSQFSGLVPTGGDGIYQYKWLISSDSHNWQDSLYTDSTNYSPFPLSDTSWFRRVVFSFNGNCVDSSNTIKLSVHPKIVNNLIAPGDTVCYGQIPLKPLVTSDSIPSGGIGNYQYRWEQSSNNSIWESASGAFTQNNYHPGILDSSMYYRRIVTSGACSDTMQNPEEASLFIKVYPKIGNNFFSIAVDTVCKSTSAKTIKISGLPTGGNNNYSFNWYRWNNGNDSISDGPIAGETDSLYNPGLIDTTTYFRRTVISGKVCVDTSNIFIIYIHPLPQGFLAGPIDTSICETGQVNNIRISMKYGKLPWTAILADPAYLANSLYASDTISINQFNSADILRSKTFEHFDFEKKILNYQISGLIDANGCYAAVKSGMFGATIYSRPTSTLANLPASVCGDSVVLNASLPNYAFGTWLPGTQNISFSDLNNKNAKLVNNNVRQTKLLDTVNLSWIAYNWDPSCYISDSGTIIFYKEPSSIIRIPYKKDFKEGLKDTTVYNNDVGLLKADTVLYPNTGKWSFVTDGSDLQISPDNMPTAMIRGLLANNTIGNWEVYWTVQNPGCPAVADSAHIESSKIHTYSGFSPGFGFKSPDGKPMDEVYWIEGIENEADFKLTVLSSWNKVVYIYHGSGAEWTGWDGKGNQLDNNGKDVPEGTYYYILEVKDQKLTGSILLRRKG